MDWIEVPKETLLKESDENEAMFICSSLCLLNCDLCIIYIY